MASQDEEMRTAGLAAKWWVLIAVGIGTFMSALDGSVVNTILPVIRNVFGDSVAAVEWVVTIYLLVVSGLLLTFGRLGDMRGHKIMYIWGFVIFVIGSMLSGLSPATGFLIAFRGLQAVGAAMLFSNSPAILTSVFPANQRGQALGMQATFTYLGLTVGPSLGGWLATTFSWRTVFYINVPVGLLALLLSWRFVPADTLSEQKERFDLAGAAVFLVGLVTLLFAMNQGSSWGWSSPATLGLLAGAMILLAIFVRVESRAAAPMLDLSLFQKRLFSIATASAILNYICLYSVVFLIPFYLIQGRGLTPAQAGLLLTAQPLIMAVAAPISGTLSDRVGSRAPATLGMAIMAVGLFVLSRMSANSPYPYIAAGLAVCGLGTGIFISPNTSALMGAAPRNRQGIASGVLATARNVGMVLGIGLAGAILTTALGVSGSDGLFAGVEAGLLAGAGAALIGSVISAVR